MKRILWDISMLGVFLAVMSFHFIPKALHEILGVVLTLMAAWHLWLNRRYFSALPRGKQSMKRILPIAINFSLMISLLLVLFTGICLSNHLFKEMIPLELARNITIHQIHVSLPFLLLIFIGLHLGLHLKAWLQRIKKFRHWQECLFSYRLLTKGMVLFFVGFGIYGSFQNRIGDRLLLKHIFATPATNSPGIIYVLLILSVVGLYTVLGYAWQEWESEK